MNKLKNFLIVFAIYKLIIQNTFADEGMWLLTILQKKYHDLQKAGLKLSYEDIYNINKASIKDAIVHFGGGCTGEIISDKGLLLTNHHCGYGAIQYHSTVEHDYLTNGFWAKSFEEELYVPNLTVTFLIRIEDVTEKIVKELNDNMTEKERENKINEISRSIEKESIKGTHYKAVVKDFFGGNQFLLMIYEVFEDVRLVGAPPSSIGKFGGDTDNWMWPRHTGDFALFRVYANKDNKPAPYSKDNVPYKPKHVLPISIKGIKSNDFVMILGYPGRTQRYLTSWGVKQAIEFTNPAIIKIREKKLSIYKKYMDADKKIKIQYASKYARTSNYWKYYIGQTKGLKKLNVFYKKQEQESKFNKWVNQNEQRKQQYGNVMNLYATAYYKLKDYFLFTTYATEAGLRGIDILNFASRFFNLYKELEADTISQEKKKKIIENLKKTTEDYYKDFNINVDKEILGELLTLFANDISDNLLPTKIAEYKKAYKGNFIKYANEAFDVSIFKSKESVLKFLENPKFKQLDKDPIFSMAYSINGALSKFQKEYEEYLYMLKKAERLYIKGLMEMQPDVIFYPDANSTMRLTYGHVLAYQPADAIFYDYYTTLDGIIEKEDTLNEEFIVPKKLKELWQKKDFGPYAENGVLKTCFISNTDITGGNSGSPVLNAYGELVGLAFDGNWEAMSGDIAFEPDLQRTISVDIRYILFIIDKFAEAKNLINELIIIKN
ncbi:MAG: S46 family peptidase [Bacteroidales bacterium]|nr:S46 family peptidase [Bacteroidales bacterium]